MSQIHILNTLHRDEGVRCKRKSIRGAIDELQYKQLVSERKIRTTEKVSRLHACGFRDEGNCYKDDNKEGRSDKGNLTDCPVRRRTVSAICKDCEKRMKKK